MFRLLIVDDEYYVRVGIKSAIDWSEIGVEVVGEAADGEEALEMALSSRPDIILTDVRMPFMDGLTLMERLRSKMPECGFIVLSGHNEFEYARQAIRQGAFAYLLKPIDRQELKDTVFAAMKKMQRGCALGARVDGCRSNRASARECAKAHSFSKKIES